MDTTVLIAGGGPAGLACAAELSHRGIDFVLVEPRDTVSHGRPRAKTTSVRTMEHFRRWGLADAVRAAAPVPLSWSQRVIFCDRLTGKEITRFERAFSLTAGRDERFAESSQAVPQPVIEEVLRDHLAGQPAARLEWGSSVVDLAEEVDHVAVTVADRSGNTHAVTTRYVLGCDGPSSLVRQRIGATLSGRSDPRPNFNVVFRAPDLTTDLANAVQYWVLGGPVPGLIGRLDLCGTWWAIFPGVDIATGTQHSARLIESLVGAPVDHELVAADPWVARMLISDRFQSSRVFLVGEAAHLNPPWGGHGYNTSVGDAVNICWKIAASEQRWGGAKLLASYERERKPVVMQTIDVAELNMASLAGDLGDQAAAIQQAKRPEFYSLGLVLGYDYASSPVVQPSDERTLPFDVSSYVPSTAPGVRLPHLWLQDGSSLYDRLGPGLTLLGPIHSAREQVTQLCDRAALVGASITVVEAPTNYAWRQEFLLIRPDQHIAWRAGSPDEIDLDLVLGRTGQASTDLPGRDRTPGPHNDHSFHRQG